MKSRSRSGQSTKLYLKRYDRPPIVKQLENWFAHRRRVSFAGVEHDAAFALCAAGIGTPHMVAWGCQWASLFEQRSFLVTQQVADSDSLERRLPACFSHSGGLQDRRRFIRSLAQFIRRFHLTGWRHRDLYLAHIFCSTSGQFCLIDLARAFRPLLARRFQVKDLAQLHYSAPAGAFSRTDRLRFYLTYCDHRRLNESDKSADPGRHEESESHGKPQQKARNPHSLSGTGGSETLMAVRIAIIIERADVALGGAERSMFEVAAALSQAGMQADLLAAKGTAAADNVHILCPDTPGKRVNMAAFERALKLYLAQNRYDIVHSVLPFDFADIYQPRGGTYAETFLRNAASYPAGLMRTLKRVTAFANFRRSRLLKAERRLCQGANGPVIAALSRYVVDQLQEHYHTPPEHIALTPNGVAAGRPVDAQAAEQLRDRIGAKDYSPLLLFVAHNFRLKGLAPLLLALRAAHEVRDSIGLVVVARAARDLMNIWSDGWVSKNTSPSPARFPTCRTSYPSVTWECCRPITIRPAALSWRPLRQANRSLRHGIMAPPINSPMAATAG